MKAKKISYVIPVFNEALGLKQMCSELLKVCEQLAAQYNYEILFVNDGSSDNSWDIITKLSQENSHIVGYNFTRNFGHQAALTAGYAKATGDAVITLDADLQDPPTLIPQLLEQWEQGAQIVYALRINRTDTLLKKWTARLYYKMLDSIADVCMPRNVGDFRLLDKKVVQCIMQFPEHARYLRGMVAWTGFAHAFVNFKRPDRFAGQTGYTWKKMFKLAFDGVTGFSLFPLKIAAYIGIFVIVSGFAMFAYITCDAIFFHKHYPLFKWLVTVIYICMGVQFLLLWILGEYIGRTYDQQKGRPLYIIADKTE